MKWIVLSFIVGLFLSVSLGCIAVQHTKVSAYGIQDGIRYNVEYTLEY